MSDFIMLVGLPASGKSTYVEKLREKGYHIHSSDKIREELTGDVNSQDKNVDVFQELHKRVKTDLRNGISCVYDATNMSMKRRKAFLDEIKKYDCVKKCILFAIPVEVCKERNAKRARKVPDYIFDKMLRKFQCPYYYEGWDEIKVITKYIYRIPLKKMVGFNQDNPHHNLDLYDHLIESQKYATENRFFPFVDIAARYHDCGKFFTKTFVDSKGNKSDVAHYYGHENYSAYLFICQAGSMGEFFEADKFDLYTACLINWHMRPYNAWKQSEKARNRDIKLIGIDMYEDIMKLHEADAHAH